jgi:hypothetical protein
MDVESFTILRANWSICLHGYAIFSMVWFHWILSCNKRTLPQVSTFNFFSLEDSEKSPTFEEFKFYVFDAPTCDGDVKSRLQTAKSAAKKLSSSIKFAEYFRMDGIQSIFQWRRSNAGTGLDLMLRNDSPYKQGKSSNFLIVQVKFFKASPFIIIF